MKRYLIILATVQLALGEADFWDLPPLEYSDAKATDPLAKLANKIGSSEQGVDVGDDRLELLRFLLKRLDVPESSQILVFSKTSHQNPLIHPKNPRSLFFSENTYLGYVPGGAIEVIIQDPVLGPVFYLVDGRESAELQIERDLSNCMSCHGTARTEGVPGVLVRSVYPNADGYPLLSLGTNHVTHETPLEERWGGYYVTGRSSIGHLGNRVYDADSSGDPEVSALRDLKERLDTSKYPRSTSDIVALMVLEHQCKMLNVLNAATLRYRRAHYLGQVLDPSGDPDLGAAGRVADGMSEKIAECLFFKNEAGLGEGVEGTEEFQMDFAKRFPRSSDGDSLADFHLYTRLFKNRCSYMVYSEAFQNLPDRVKRPLLRKMRGVLAGRDPEFDWLSKSESRRISKILSETLPGWAD